MTVVKKSPNTIFGNKFSTTLIIVSDQVEKLILGMQGWFRVTKSVIWSHSNKTKEK